MAYTELHTLRDLKKLRHLQLLPKKESVSVQFPGWEMQIGPGHVLGTYTVHGYLRSGGQNHICVGSDASGRSVALKFPKDVSSADARLFEEERRTHRSLGSHPYIVEIYDVGTHADIPYEAIEFVEGIPVSSVIDDNVHCSGTFVASVGRMLATALSHVHSKGRLHNDLKPGNVMLDLVEERRFDSIWSDLQVLPAYDVFSHLLRPYPTAQLLDFSLSLPIGESLESPDGKLYGTPGYMDPERLMSDPPTERSEIYCLGITLYEMLTSEPVFPDKSPDGLVRRVLLDPPSTTEILAKRAVRTSMTNLERHVCTVAGTCLAPEPGDRYASMRDVAAELRV